MKPASLKLCKLVLVPLAVYLSAGLGNAQNAYQGRFTLPFEARWQNVVLPAGTYTLSMYSTAAPCRLVVRGAGQSVMISGVSSDTKPLSDTSQLLLVRSGDSYIVRSLEAGPIGLDIDYRVGSGKATHMATVSVPIEHASVGK